MFRDGTVIIKCLSEAINEWIFYKNSAAFWSSMCSITSVKIIKSKGSWVYWWISPEMNWALLVLLKILANSIALLSVSIPITSLIETWRLLLFKISYINFPSPHPTSNNDFGFIYRWKIELEDSFDSLAFLTTPWSREK